MVTAVAYTNFRKDLKSYLRRVNDDADMLLVTNKDPRDNVVVMSADDYDSLMETLRVYQNPGLFDKVRRGMSQVRSGSAAAHDLVVVHAVGMVRERVEQIHAHLGHVPVVRVRDRAGAERAGQVAEVEVHRASSPMIHGMTSSASRR